MLVVELLCDSDQLNSTNCSESEPGLGRYIDCSRVLIDPSSVYDRDCKETCFRLVNNHHELCLATEVRLIMLHTEHLLNA